MNRPYFLATVPLIALLIGWPGMGTAATFNPTSINQLVQDIQKANTNGQPDVINLVKGKTYSLMGAAEDSKITSEEGNVGPNGLPRITSKIVINGNEAIIERAESAPPFRIFEVKKTGDLTINNLTIQNGRIAGPSGGGGGGAFGGAIFNGGRLVLNTCVFTGNGVKGGDGGSGGGGGGFGNSGGTYKSTKPKEAPQDGGNGKFGGGGGTGGPGAILNVLDGKSGTEPFKNYIHSKGANGGMGGFGGGSGGGGWGIYASGMNEDRKPGSTYSGGGGGIGAGNSYGGGKGGDAWLNRAQNEYTAGGGGGGAGFGGAIFNHMASILINSSSIEGDNWSVGGKGVKDGSYGKGPGGDGVASGGGIFNNGGTIRATSTSSLARTGGNASEIIQNLPVSSGQALSLNNTEQYVYVARSASLDGTKSAMTWEAWIKTDAPSKGYQIIMEWSDHENTLGAQFFVKNGKELQTTLVTEDGRAPRLNVGSVLEGGWNHVALTYGGGTAQLYCNGMKVGNPLNVGGNLKTAKQFIIGRRRTNPSLNFVGQIDEVRVWNRALSAAEIAENRYRSLSSGNGLVASYNFNGSAADASGQNLGKVAGGTGFGPSGIMVYSE